MRIFSSLSRFIFVFAIICLFKLQANASVGITQPTGGQNISIDKAVGGSAAGFTVLGNIVIADNLATDFTTGTGVTFVLTAPAGWQFKAGVGSIGRAGTNLTAASIGITATAITVTYTASGAQVAGNSLTISNIEVQPTTTGVGTALNITRTAGTGVIAGFANTTPVASLSKVPGAFVKLQTLLPGEVASPGSATGKTAAAPTTQASTVAFNVTVNAVDAGWNIITAAPSDNIQITSSDATAILPANNTLASGTQTFSVALKASGSRTVTATNVTDGTKTAGTSAGVTVTAGALVKLQVLMPGETAAPGTVSGKTGTPNPVTAGTAYAVTVNAVDANWNKVSSTDVINISTTGATNATVPANAALVAGTKNYNVTFKTAGETPTITASDVTAPSNTASTGPSLTINTGAFSKLQVLLPGESALPGSASGKIINSPTSVVAGTAITVTVNAVDANWNKITSVTDVARITSSDINAILPADNALVAGTQTFNVTLKTSGNKTITASNFTDGTKTANTSPNVAVGAGAFIKLLLIVPGETYAAGTVTGKTGVPTTRSAGTQFPISIYAVDIYNNRVTTVTDVINIASNDPLGTNPANTTLVSGTKNVNVNLRTLSTTSTITATDVTDGTKTPYTTANLTVAIGAVNKLQVLLPGETAAPGTSTGKTGTPTAQTAGSSFMITVNAVDAAWNLVTSVTDVVRITSPTYTTATTLPADAALVAGTGTFAVALNRATGQTVKASDITTPAVTANTSAVVTVNVAAFAKLQVLLPGETTAPGTATGKTGTPTAQSAGVSFNATVNAVDAYWNKITSVTDVVNIASGDAADAMPPNAALVAGTKANFAVILRTSGSRTITASDVTDGTKTSNVSSAVTISAGAYAKLQLLLPGETAAPGTASGKTGTPTAQTAGSSFVVTVNAVDAAWNLVSATDVVRISTTDVNNILPADAALVAGTKNFNVTLKTALATRTITATNVTDGTKSPNTSPAVTVSPGAYAQLQVLLPGETAAPGTATGVINNPNIPTRNTAFNIKVTPVDAYYNVVSGITNAINLTSSDPAAVLTTPSSLVNGGTRTLSVNIKTAGSQTISVTDATTAFNTVVTVTDPTIASLITDHFRTVDSGIWTDAAIWESSTDGLTAWHAATLTPTSGSATISIRNTHVVTISANLTVDQVTVQTGGKINLTAGTLTIANGTGDDLIVSGTLTSSSTITTTGTLYFNAGGTYQHNFAAVTGTIPTATWTTGSICEIIGYTSYTGAITGSGQTFADFVWNCPNQNNSGNGPTLAGTFGARDFTVSATGTGNVYLGSGGGTATISRNYLQTGGNTVLNKAGAFTENLNIAGNFTLSGGTFQKGTSTASNVVFNGTTTQIFSKSGSTISGAVNFTINAAAIVDFGTSVLDGTSGTFTLTAGGTIITANDDGLAATGTNSGSIQNTGTRTYNAGNFTYNGNDDQLAGTGLPLSIANLTISNASGVTLPSTSSTYAISGVLSINPAAGFLDMKTNILSGTFTNTGAGTLKTQASSGFATGKTWTVGVEFNSTSSQNIISGTYNKTLVTSGAGTKVGPSGALTIAGDWSSAGGEVDLISNSTPITFSGASSQSIADAGSNGGDGILFRNVTFSGGGNKTLTSGDFSISTTGVLTMGSSTILNAGGNLTLLSNASSSGSVAAVPSNSSIRGSVKVQRFVNGGLQNPYRTYRMLSSPVYDNTSSFINSNTPGNRTYGFSQFIDDMIITGSGGSNNGFDTTPQNAATAFTYNDGFVAVTDINTNVNVGRGTYIFYRGDRSDFTGKTVAPFEDPESAIIDFDGILNQQSITVPLTYSASVTGYNIVGNPYASTIDWNSGSWTKTSMLNVVRIWDPSTRQYATYDGSVGVNGGSQYIPAGQSFFVQANDGSGSLTFAEATKVTSQPGTLLLSTRSTSDVLNVVVPTELRIKLKKDLAFNQDETVIIMAPGKAAAFVQEEDVTHLDGDQVYLSSLSTDSKKLVINYMPEIENVSAVKLNVDAFSSGDYYLEFGMSNVPSGYTVQLKDSYLNTISNITDGIGYLLGIDKTDVASFGADRFTILISPPVTLPVSITGPSASKVTEGVAVKWTTSSEVNNHHFDVERAGENGTYGKIGQVLAQGPSKYTFLDKTPLIGNNYYRLRQVDNDGKEAFFGPAAVKYDLSSVGTSSVAIFPNPVNDQFTIKFTGVLTSAKQTVKVINATGQVQTTKTVTKEELNNGYDVNVSNYPAGVYVVEVLDATTNKRVGLLKMIKL